MTNTVRQNSPSSTTDELFRSIDVYMLICTVFVVAALCEGALVGMTAPNIRQVKNTFKTQVKKIIEKSRRTKKPTLVCQPFFKLVSIIVIVIIIIIVTIPKNNILFNLYHVL